MLAYEIFLEGVVTDEERIMNITYWTLAGECWMQMQSFWRHRFVATILQLLDFQWNFTSFVDFSRPICQSYQNNLISRASGPRYGVVLIEPLANYGSDNRP